MLMWATKSGAFCASHHLPEYEGNCSNLHGHTYKVQVSIGREMALEYTDDLVIDFKELGRIVKKVCNKYDHTHLNEHFTYPSTENVTMRIIDEVIKELTFKESVKVKVKVWESDTSYICMTIETFAIYDEGDK